jgi:dihydroneopterin aldolase
MNFPNLKNHDGRELDQVQLTGMLMSCVIGIFPSERSRKQPVSIDLCLYLDTRRAAKSANIHDTIDYAGALKEISFILDHCEFLLIETAVEAICRHFILTYQADHSLPKIDAVIVRISKPSALTHGVVPSVQVLRRREDYIMPPSISTNHAIYPIHDAADARLSLLVAPHDCQIDITQWVADAKAVLPIGRWSLNSEVMKSRSAVTLNHASPQIFSSRQVAAPGPRVLLIQSGHG